MADDKPSAPTEPASAPTEPESAPTEPASAPTEPAAHDEVLKKRYRRQKLLRGKPRTKFSEFQQWIFIGLALLVAVAWIFGRDACTRKISDTYGTLTNKAPRDGGTGDAGAPPAMRPEDDGW